MEELKDEHNQEIRQLALQSADKDKQKKAVQDILAKLVEKQAPRLWERWIAGENLSDREIAFLMYSKFPKDVILVEKFENECKKRDLLVRSEVLALEYTKEKLGDVSMQTALRGLIDIPIWLVTHGWSGLTEALAQTYSNNIGSNIMTTLTKAPVQYWVIARSTTAVFVVWDTVKALYKLSKGEITIKEAMKRVSGSLSTNGGAFGGAHVGISLGGSIGALAGPFGAIIGSIIGCFVGSLVGSLLGSLLNKGLWSLFDKDPVEGQKELIKNAYKTLEVLNSTPLEEIKRRYRQKLLLYHPDKNPGATKEELESLKLRLIEVRSAFALLIAQGIIKDNYKTADEELQIKIVREAIEDDEF